MKPRIVVMTEAEKEKLVAEWVDFQSVPLEERSREFRKNYELNGCWAVTKLFDLGSENPELAWELILAINKVEINDNVEAVLAAGSLEDLLNYHGEQFIERIEI